MLERKHTALTLLFLVDSFHRLRRYVLPHLLLLTMMFKIASLLALAASVSADCPINLGTYSGMSSLIPAGREATTGCMRKENKAGNGPLKETVFGEFGPEPGTEACAAATCANVPVTVEQSPDFPDDCIVTINECFSNFAGGFATGVLEYNCDFEPTGNNDFECSLRSFEIQTGDAVISTDSEGSLDIKGHINGQGSVNWEVFTAVDDKKVGMVSLARQERVRNLRG